MARNLENFLRDFYKSDDEGRTLADREMSSLSLKQLYTLVDMEIAGRRSASVLRRIHARLTRARASEERSRLERNRKDWRV